MKNGIEVRKNGSTIERYVKEGYVGYNVIHKLKDGTLCKCGGSPWDYLHNARKSADNLGFIQGVHKITGMLG